jgi:hypothetical protein
MMRAWQPTRDSREMDSETTLQTEADRLRKLAIGFTDEAVLSAIEQLVNELESRSRLLENGAGRS